MKKQNENKIENQDKSEQLFEEEDVEDIIRNSPYKINRETETRIYQWPFNQDGGEFFPKD